MALMYYTGDNGQTGYELYAINEAGVSVLIKDFRPGMADTLSSGGGAFHSVNGIMYMLAPGAEANTGTFNLYRVDGSNVTQLTHFSDPNGIVGGTGALGAFSFAGQTFFLQRFDGQPYDLYSLSGGAASRVGPLVQGTTIYYASDFIDLGSQLFFTALVSGQGYQLFRTGTGGNGQQVTAPSGFSLSSTPDLVKFGTSLYFAGSTTATGTELYKVTESGVVTLVADINPGNASSSVYMSNTSTTVFNGELYFQAATADTGTELWKIRANGTVVQVADINPDAGSSYASPVFKIFNGEAYFTAAGTTGDFEIWKVRANGTVALVNDVNPGTASSDPALYNGIELKGSLYFWAKTQDTGRELFRLDGDGSVEIVKDLVVGTGSSTRQTGTTMMIAFNDELYFNAWTAATGDALWKLDDSGVVVLVKNFIVAADESTYGGDDILGFQIFGDALYLTAWGKTEGREMWRVSSTGAITQVTDNPGPGSGFASGYFIFPPPAAPGTPTTGDDNLVGTSGPNTIDGLAGDDTIAGLGGIDNLSGNTGDDVLIGGADNDTLDGGADYDTADYREKTQSVKVELKGYNDAKVFVNGVEEDTIRKIENVYGGTAKDDLTGDSYKNYLYGAGADDLLQGMAGKDRLNGGSGYDVADYREKTVDVKVALLGYNEATVYVDGVAEDTVLYIENVYGGSGDDTLTGDGYKNYLYGADGDDMLKGGVGIDRLHGGGNYDTADYRDKTVAVKVALNGYSEATVYVNAVAEDVVLYVENVYGGSGADTLTGDSFKNYLYGAAGDDLLKGGAGIDRLHGGDNYDTADYSDKTTAVTVTLKGYSETTVSVGGTVEDTILYIERIIGGSAGDTLVGDSFKNTFTGRGGNDTLTGAGGDDFFVFNVAPNSTSNRDTITDMNESGNDTIQLENTGTGLFNALTTLGTLTSPAYGETSDGKATTALQRIIYEIDTGKVFYDSNGSDAGGVQFQFATLDANKASSYSASDFVVI